MIWNWFKNVIFFPVIWFWKQYQKCKEENAVGKMVALFGFSLTGLVCIGVALVWLISFLINSANAHPEAVLIIIGIIWIYLYGKSRMARNEVQNQQVLMQKEQDLTFQHEKALQGYASIANAMYQVLREIAGEIDSQTPGMIAEIEMPEEKYTLRDNVCFYQFMTIKRDSMKVYDQDILDEFKKTVQFTIHNKLHSGTFPSIVIV